MNWNQPFNLEVTHAFLSPCQTRWINYDDDKLIDRVNTSKATARGTELHEFAATAIKNYILLPDNNDTLNRYINDGVKYKMDPEVLLFYSKWIYGTADTISFRHEKDISEESPVLRIHDLKTGSTPAKMTQLHIYAGLFCLEYQISPGDIFIITRIYQNNRVVEDRPTTDVIFPIMDKIQHFSNIIDQMNLKQGEY